MATDLEAMAVGQNWAAVVIDNNGVMVYNEQSADAEYGWKAVPEEIKAKYTTQD